MITEDADMRMNRSYDPNSSFQKEHVVVGGRQRKIQKSKNYFTNKSAA